MVKQENNSAWLRAERRMEKKITAYYGMFFILLSSVLFVVTTLILNIDFMDTVLHQVMFFGIVAIGLASLVASIALQIQIEQKGNE